MFVIHIRAGEPARKERRGKKIGKERKLAFWPVNKSGPISEPISRFIYDVFFFLSIFLSVTICAEQITADQRIDSLQLIIPI